MQSFLHTQEWQEFQESLGRTTIKDSGKNWSYVAFKESGPGHSRLYVPYGPICDSSQGFRHAIRSLKMHAKKEHCAFIRLDSPSGVSADDLRASGCRPVTFLHLQPADTQIIDLSIPEDQLLANMKQNSRNITRNYQKKGLTIRQSHRVDDISILVTLLNSVAAHNNITVHSASYFKQQAAILFPTHAATLYIAELQKTPVAAALVFDSKDTRTYAHAAADYRYRSLNAGTALLGQLILDAKEKGLSWVDLYGISPEDDPSHPWNGFTKFKQSFGGTPVHSQGLWDIPLQPVRYWLYQNYLKIRRRFH